jgi:hypothetical protein
MSSLLPASRRPRLPPRRRHVRYRALPLVLATCLVVALDADASPEQLNGTWSLDAEGSQDFETAGREMNERLNEEARSKSKQKFGRDEQSDPSGNRFQAQASAAHRMIREDRRSYDWEVPEEAEPIVEAESIKIYLARKLAILYGDELRRLLAINPGGRVYSVRGTEYSDDEIGRSLTWIDGDALVIETGLVVGGKLVERYELDAASERLVVTVRLQQQPGAPWLEFVRRFARAG